MSGEKEEGRKRSRRPQKPPFYELFKRERATLVYGPSKAGKTRFAAYVAASLGPEPIHFYVTEVNYTEEDIYAILGACVAFGKKCRVYLIESPAAFRNFAKQLASKANIAFARRTRKSQTALKAEEVPATIVVDSVAGVAAQIAVTQTESILESGASAIPTRINPLAMAIFTPLRQIVNVMRGMLLLISHATYLPGVAYKGLVPAKPRYANYAAYVTDAEVYVTYEELDLVRCQAGHRTAVVVDARRSPEYVGQAYCLEPVTQRVVARVSVAVRDAAAMTEYTLGGDEGEERELAYVEYRVVK